MAASVPERRITVSTDITGAVRSGIAISKLTRAVPWVGAASLQCWIAGRGSMDVPSHAPFDALSDLDTAEYRYWTKPRYQTTRYALTVGVSTTAGRTTATVQFPIGGDSQTIQVERRADMVPVVFYADRSAQSSAEAEIGCLIVAPESLGISVDLIQIEALPRGILVADANDLGANRTQFRPRQPIIEETLVNQILDRQNDLRDAARRVGLWQQSRGTLNPWSFAGTYAALTTNPVTFLPRQLYSSSTTYTCSWRVLAKCSDGTTAGDIRVSNDSGGTGVSTITIPAGTTSWTWLPSTAGAAATFTCKCEDNTEPDGLRGGTHDEHTFEARRTAGVGTVEIATVSVFDAAA